jgi:hypothetical protein
MIEFGKQPMLRNISLYLITGGIFGFYWLLKYGYKIYFSRDVRIKKIFYVFILACLTIFISVLAAGPIFSAIGASSPAVFKKLIFIELLIALLLYIGTGAIAVDIAGCINACNKNNGERIQVSAQSAFFFTLSGFASSLYLQNKINKLG